jgi:hypothetical protein
MNKARELLEEVTATSFREMQMTGRFLEDFAVGQTFRSGRLRIDKERIKTFGAGSRSGDELRTESEVLEVRPSEVASRSGVDQDAKSRTFWFPAGRGRTAKKQLTSVRRRQRNGLRAQLAGRSTDGRDEPRFGARRQRP